MYSQFHNVSLILKWVSSTFLLILTPPTFAEWVQIDALVNTVNGSPQSVFQVLRAGQKLDVIPMMVLQDGDWLCVRQPKNGLLKDAQNYVMLTFGSNQSAKVTFANSPYLVKKRGTTISLSKNVIADTKQSWAEMFTNYLKAVQISIRKAEPVALSIPLLKKYGEQQLLSGKRALRLAWRGGNAPYWVQVFPGETSKALLATNTGIYSKQVQFEKRMLNAGDYRVVVNDANGQTIEGKFQVIENLPLPLKQVKQEMQTSKISEPAKWTLFAAWLAQQSAFRFEAYQQTMEIAKEYQPALLLKNGLEK